MTKIKNPFALILVLLLVALIVGVALWMNWNASPRADKKLPPRVITLSDNVGQQVEDAIAEANWVSPGLDGPALYILGYRTCPDCINYKLTEFEGLHAAGVDTRVMYYARRGEGQSLPEERAVVAEIYDGDAGGWELFERWTGENPHDAVYYRMEQDGTLPEIPEGNPKLEAVIETGRLTRERLEAAMAEEGYDMEVPSLFYKNEDGKWRAFLGDFDRGKKQLRKELGVR